MGIFTLSHGIKFPIMWFFKLNTRGEMSFDLNRIDRVRMIWIKIMQAMFCQSKMWTSYGENFLWISQWANFYSQIWFVIFSAWELIDDFPHLETLNITPIPHNKRGRHENEFFSPLLRNIYDAKKFLPSSLTSRIFT